MSRRPRRTALGRPSAAVALAAAVAAAALAGLAGWYLATRRAADDADADAPEVSPAVAGVVVNARVAHDTNSVALVMHILGTHSARSFVILHPEIASDDPVRTALQAFTLLDVALEPSVFHLLKEIRPDHYYLPGEMVQTAVDAHNIDHFLKLSTRSIL